MNQLVAFHPNPEMLAEFSAGTLDTAPSICISAHIHFCQNCRQQLSRLEDIGARLMEQASPVEVGDDLLDAVMAQLESEPEPQPKPVETHPEFPHVVSKLLAQTPVKKWRRVTSVLDMHQFVTGQNDYEVALHKIAAGGKVPHHDHRGEEFTVVLKGSFSDELGVYRAGDFLLRSSGDKHQPVGAQNEECICLSAVSAPIRLTNPLGFLLRPWLSINPQ